MLLLLLHALWENKVLTGLPKMQDEPCALVIKLNELWSVYSFILDFHFCKTSHPQPLALFPLKDQHLPLWANQDAHDLPFQWIESNLELGLLI